jgi:hypothetical protein
MVTNTIKDLRRKQRRRRKVRFLKNKLAETTNPVDRRRIIEKIKRVSPRAPVPEN